MSDINKCGRCGESHEQCKDSTRISLSVVDCTVQPLDGGAYPFMAMYVCVLCEFHTVIIKM